jgi:predicted HD superfamily hydrolase involved in NAD metabolism
MPASIAVQIAAVRAEMETRPPGLVRHVLRVLEEAIALAGYWDVDPGRVELATWGHDLFRAHAPAEQLRLAREAGIAVDPADEASPVFLHGPIAAGVLRERFGVVDDDVVAAVRDHTLGLAEMPLLAKVLLIADKVERNKRDRAPLMREVRLLARRDLDTALLCWADWKWVDERTRGWGSHPLHRAARVAWVAEHHADAALPGRVSAAAFAAAARE